MSSVRGGRGGAGRGRGASTFGAPAGPKAARPSFAPRAGRGSNQVRFNGQPRGGGAGASAERGSGRGGFRGGSRGRAKTTLGATRSPSTPSAAPTPAQLGNGSSSSYPDRFQALKKQREQERTYAIAQGFLADPDKPRTLAEAITPVGTCPDMCAEYERVERIVQKDVWGPEADDNSAPAEHRMVKKFRRAAAGLDEQLPSDLRPPSVLKKTVDYLFDDIVANASSLGSVHHFVWDRTRAVRNDFSIQQITKPSDVQIAIECYERIARFHILSLHQLAVPDKPYDKYDWYQEREQLDRTLLSLMQYYDDSRGRLQCQNEAEFRAYLIIFQAQDPTPDLDERVNTWPLSVKSDGRVRIALDLNSAASNIVDPQGPLKPRALYPVAREDWSRFFDLVRSVKVSYLMACVAEIYFKLVRRTALNAIWRGFKGQLPDFTLSLMTELLGFDDMEQTEDFCQHFGFVFSPSEIGEPFLNLNSVQGKTFPQEAPGLDHQTFSERLVEYKRMGRTFSAVIRGYTVADAQNSGLIDESYDSQMEDSQVEEDEDSLFVPMEPPRPPPVPATNSAPSSSPFAAVFDSTKPTSEGSPSIFAQQKPIGSTFGQPSAANSTTSSAFSFGKPSVAPLSEPAAPAPSPFSGFGQPTANTSPFAFAKPPTPSTNTDADKSTDVSTNPFSIPKVPVTIDEVPPTTGASLFSKPSTSILGQVEPAPSTSPATISSIFQTTAAANQPVPSKPTFSFSSTQETASQPSNTTANSTEHLFKTPEPAVQPTESSQPSTSGFSTPTPTFAQAPSFSPTPPPAATLVNAPPGVFKIPPSNTTQPNQPKKPSPLSQSFTFTKEPTTKPPQSDSVTPSPQVPAIQNSLAPPAAPIVEKTISLPPKPAKSKDAILDQLAREVVLDVDRGLIRQFVEYHARQAVMGVYDELYMESIRELADTFRKETLSYRYGKRWREICWRRRLARQGRERRKRAKKDQSARELKRKLATERDAVDDFLKSTSQARQLGKSFNGSRVGRTDNATPVGHVSGDTDAAPTDGLHNHKRLKSTDNVDETKTAKGQMQETTATPRSNFLGFSMMASQNRPAISSTPSKSNYFRLKALGINPGGDAIATPHARKRLREESEEHLTEVSPPTKRSHTPPLVAEDMSGIHSHGSTKAKATNSAASLVAKRLESMPSTKLPSKAQQEDEALFARARAARQAMAESGAWYRSEMQKEEIRRSEEVTLSLTSPSMERARQAARLRASRNNMLASTNNAASRPDVPAYRLRESRFVPREHYNRALERAKQNIESRSQSPVQASPRGQTNNLSRSSPMTTQSPSRSAETRQAMQFTRHTRPLTQFASQNEKHNQAADSLVQFATVHKLPEDSAWNYDPTFFAQSIDPALSEAGTNVHIQQASTRSYSDSGENSKRTAQVNCTEFIDMGSDDESDDVHQEKNLTHQDGSQAEGMVYNEVYDEEGGEGYVGGYAQNPEDFQDEEDYDDEEDQEEEYDDDDDEEEEEEEETEDSQVDYPDLPVDDGNSTIKAGTGTAEDAFELSD